MILVCEMQNGEVFEASSKKKLTESMINYFGENDEDAGQIKAVYCIFKNERADEICNNAVSKIQEIIDKGVSDWRKYANENWQGQKEIERDYYANLL